MAKTSLANYQRFGKEYFSGTDVYIFFNNVLVDKIVSIEFELAQAMNFITGYASYTTDAVAYGSRLVNGRFRINFTENMYLFAVSGLVGYSKYDGGTVKESINVAQEKLWSDSNITSEQFITMMKNGKTEKISAIIDACEERLWGTSETEPIQNKWRTPFFTNNTKDMWSGINEKGFDIVISYGNENFPVGLRGETLPSTVKVINGVFLTGVAQVIEPTGNNIYEEYTFMAKDMDNTIGTSK